MERNDIQFWTKDPWADCFLCKFPPETEDTLRKLLEDRVLVWLKEDGDRSLEISTADTGGKAVKLLWRKFEVHIKDCLNSWWVWRMAVCSHYDKMVSYKIKEIGSNEVDKVEHFRFPNQIDSYERRSFFD